MATRPRKTELLADVMFIEGSLAFRLEALKHLQLTPKQVSQLLADRSWQIRAAIPAYYKLMPAQVLVLFKDKYTSVRVAVVRHCKLSDKMLNDALTDAEHEVRLEAVKNFGLRMTVAQLQFALADDNEAVRVATTRVWVERGAKAKGRFYRQARPELKGAPA